MDLKQIKKDVVVMSFDRDAQVRLATSLPELITRYETLIAMQEAPAAPEEVPQPKEDVFTEADDEGFNEKAVEALAEIAEIVEEDEAE